MRVALVIFYVDAQEGMYMRTLTWKQIGHSTMGLHVFFSNEKHNHHHLLTIFGKDRKKKSHFEERAIIYKEIWC